MRLPGIGPAAVALSLSLAPTAHGTIFSFVPSPRKRHVQQRRLADVTALFSSTEKFVPAEPTVSTVTDPNAVRLKEELLSIASATKRGFAASSSQRKRANEIVYELAKYNPTEEPAAAYYIDSEQSVSGGPTLSGKWTLCYTDAPDITTLDGGPLATAKLGRIGQECYPPFIKNVIEWRRPDWASSFPLSGSDDSRVLQKVCCEAMAKPEKPKIVDLKLAGFDLLGFGGGGATDDESIEIGNNGKDVQESSFLDKIKRGPAGLLEDNPVELQGPLRAPFGQFEVLYLDEEMRIIKTGQNYLAVNVRDEEEWF